MIIVNVFEKGNRRAEVYDNWEWNEYVVMFYVDGKYLDEADAHEDDEASACDTARYWLNN